MRTLLAAGLLAGLATVVAVDAARAQIPSPYGPLYPWCAELGIRGGATNCYFANLWQCQQAISGNGGFCYANPFYVAARQAGPPPLAPRKRRD